MPPKFTIAVADLDSSSGQGITDLVISQLSAATKQFTNIRIIRLQQQIRPGEDEDAIRAIGKKSKANLVAWGVYHQRDKDVAVILDVTIVNPPFRRAFGDREPHVYPRAILDRFRLEFATGGEITGFALLLAGLERMENRDFAEARSMFSQSLLQPHRPDRLPNIAFVYLLRANCALALNDFASAVDDSGHAIRVLSSVDYPWGKNESLACAAYIAGGLSRMGQTNLLLAHEDVQTALTLSPSNIEAKTVFGIVLLRMKDTRAVSVLDEVLNAKAEDTEVLAHAAYAHHFLGDKKRALTLYSLLISKTKGEPLPVFMRGILYCTLSNPTSAIRDFITARELATPKRFARTPEFLFWPGGDWKYQGKPEQILAALAVRNQARCLTLHSDQKEEAIRLHTLYLDYDPTNGTAYAARADAYQRVTNYAAAISDLTMALKLGWTCDEGHYRRGSIYYVLNQKTEAEEDYRAAIKCNPTNLPAWQMLGRVLGGRSNWVEATVYFSKCIQIDTNNSDVYFDRALCYLGQFDLPKAVADLTQCLRLKPDFIGARLRRAEAFLRLDQFDLAEEDCRVLATLSNTIESASAINSLSNAISVARENWRIRQRWLLDFLLRQPSAPQ